ncbi:MAG: nucleotidyl transferase AbiEii/AbiGii toxin family protein [Opitutae bacterium]|nr:nucleotidyl transferase AbiEii/AbiGii toxin family protein [Opitutae bacterium]
MAGQRNLPASVRQQLLNLSAKRGEAFDLVLVRFAIERLLYRLSQSPHADRFLLKGAMLFAIWLDGSHRPTRDVDLLGFGPDDANDITAVFREVCAVAVEDDGLQFQASTLRVDPIRGNTHYSGLRVRLEARLSTIRIPVQVDIGFGDAVTPEPETVTFPGLLDFATPVLRAYPIYTVVAEKTEAMVHLGETNTRMKDFYDVWFLSGRFDFDGPTLAKAMYATFARRRTALPAGMPLALTEGFVETRAPMWRAFLRRNGLRELPFPEVSEKLREFLGPVLASPHQEIQRRHWKANRGWIKLPSIS